MSHDDFCHQVLDWLDKHGESFLKKNVGIGRTLSRAQALQKSQLHFESVAKVSEVILFNSVVVLGAHE